MPTVKTIRRPSQIAKDCTSLVPRGNYGEQCAAIALAESATGRQVDYVLDHLGELSEVLPILCEQHASFRIVTESGEDGEQEFVEFSGRTNFTFDWTACQEELPTNGEKIYFNMDRSDIDFFAVVYAVVGHNGRVLVSVEIEGEKSEE